MTPRRAFSISGIHTVEGAEAVALDDGSDAAILGVDGEVLVLHAKERAVSYLRHARLPEILQSHVALGEWPCSQERVALAALKVSGQPLRPPLVCNFLSRGGTTWAVDESTGLVVLEIRPQNAEVWSERGVALPLYSANLSPRAPTRIVARASNFPFRPTRLVVLMGANFLVHDIQIGARSQLATHEPLPGDLFSASQLESIHLEIVPQGTDVAVVASYVGDDPAGGDFRAMLLGWAEKRPAGVQIRWTPKGRPVPWVNLPDPPGRDHA